LNSVSLPDKGIHDAWSILLENGIVQVILRIVGSDLALDNRWKPVFKNMIAVQTPSTWMPPGREECNYGALNEMQSAYWRKYIRNESRENRQSKYLDELRTKSDAHKVKSEL
jgi:hypothetical protein